MTMAAPGSWDGLAREFDLWAKAGRTAPLWWRDDDATKPAAALDRLLDLAGTAGVPVCLAIIPADANAALAGRLGETAPDLAVAVHGWGHRNHAPEGEKKAEFGPHRPIDEMAAEAARGLARTVALFGDRALAVFVPPWNRIAPGLIPRLPAAGFTGLSGRGTPKSSTPVTGITVADIHSDMVDWRARAFGGEASVLATITAELEARRGAGGPLPQPVGVLSHHLVMDEPAWRFAGRLAAAVANHPGAGWTAPRHVFGAGS